jgi:hypothetical protein
MKQGTVLTVYPPARRQESRVFRQGNKPHSRWFKPARYGNKLSGGNRYHGSPTSRIMAHPTEVGRLQRRALTLPFLALGSIYVKPPIGTCLSKLL